MLNTEGAFHNRFKERLAGSEDEAHRYLDMGFTFVSRVSDIGLLKKGTRELIQSFKTA